MKHKFLQLLLFSGIIYANAFAQPVIRWQKTIGGYGYDYFSSMDLTKDGGLIVGGTSESDISGEKTENSRGAEDYWLLKLDSTHKIKWDKTIGGIGDDFFTSLEQTTDGGYILGGSSNSSISGEKTENSRGSYDYWVVKLNRSGKIQWNKTIGGSSADILNFLQQTSDGGFILGGYSGSNISGEKTENSRGQADYWVVKLDGSGKIQWDKTIGGSGDEELTSLQQTSNGGYILGGWSNSNISGEKTENSRGGYDYWIVKLGALGKIQWDKTLGGSGEDNLTSLQQIGDGGYILGGYSNSNRSREKTQNSKGGWDYWLVKLNAFGKVQWDKTIGGNGGELLFSVQQTYDDGYILGGSSNSNKSGDKSENSRGLNDYWVVKLNKFGKIQWDKTIGGANVDECYSVKEITGNRYILGGYSSSGISGDKTEEARGVYGAFDYWIVKLVYNAPGSFDITELQNENNIIAPKTNSKGFVIYPNPAKDILHVQINNKAIVSLADQSGKVLLTTTINGSGIINVATLKPGLYYLKNHTTGAVQKVIIAK